ncbi:hypothetical protein GCM10017687_77730 [Streptomyces echinatus]
MSEGVSRSPSRAQAAASRSSPRRRANRARTRAYPAGSGDALRHQPLPHRRRHRPDVELLHPPDQGALFDGEGGAVGVDGTGQAPGPQRAGHGAQRGAVQGGGPG